MSMTLALGKQRQETRTWKSTYTTHQDLCLLKTKRARENLPKRIDSLQFWSLVCIHSMRRRNIYKRISKTKKTMQNPSLLHTITSWTCLYFFKQAKKVRQQWCTSLIPAHESLSLRSAWPTRASSRTGSKTTQRNPVSKKKKS